MKVRFAPRALAEAKRRKTWWLKNRPAAPDLFELELGAALSTLVTTPNMCKVYEADVRFPVRRVLLKKTATHCTGALAVGMKGVAASAGVSLERSRRAS